MEVNAISPYGTTNSYGKNGLTMDDFLSLMVAQLANQDMYNTVDDTQFLTQMAQFSMIEALSELSRASTRAYSLNMIGKQATVSSTNSDGSIKITTGIVEGVSLYNGEAQLEINGSYYPLSQVMEVRNND